MIQETDTDITMSNSLLYLFAILQEIPKTRPVKRDTKLINISPLKKGCPFLVGNEPSAPQLNVIEIKIPERKQKHNA